MTIGRVFPFEYTLNRIQKVELIKVQEKCVL